MSSSLTKHGSRNLAFLLLDRFRWFQRSLRSRLDLEGVPEMTIPQILILPNLDAGGTRISELARRVGVSRQAVHQTLGELADLGLLEVVADPTHGRARLARLTNRGRKIDRDALKVIARLERDLASRIGKRNLADLHRALEADWGAPAGAREGAAD